MPTSNRILALSMPQAAQAPSEATDMTISDHAHPRPNAAAPIRRSAVQRVVDRVGVHNISLIFALVVLCAIFGYLRGDVFFSSRNILNIGLAVTILGVLAMSQTVVIVAGGLDVSVGSTVGFATVATAMVAQSMESAALAVLAGLAVGAACGLVNGIIITYGRVNAVIATLGTMAIFRGVAFILSDGQSISIFDDTFRFMGNGRVLGVPFPIWVLALTAVLFQIFLSQSIAGRNVYAIGGNPVVARFSGINVNRYRVAIYIMSGFVAGPRRHHPGGAHRLGPADLRLAGAGARGDHRGRARRLRAAGRPRHDRRRAARRPDHRRPQQRHDPHRRADLLPAACQRRSAHIGCAGRRVSPESRLKGRNHVHDHDPTRQ